jgi:NAD+ synthetase
MSLNVLLCQINNTPNRFQNNLVLIKACLKQAYSLISEGNTIDLIVFPELTIPGYLCKDLIYTENFIEQNHNALNHIINVIENDFPALKRTRIVIGYFDKNNEGVGKPFKNKLAVIHGGIIEGTYTKHLLPFYDVFDEARYCEPGTEHLVLRIGKHKVGFTICEDMWNDKMVDDYSYSDNPIQYYRNIGCDTLVNISSSPFVKGKPNLRQQMLEKISRDGDMTVIYCNQQGAHDELVFDGRSTVIVRGNTAAVMDANMDDINARLVTWNDKSDPQLVPRIYINSHDEKIEYIYNVMVLALRDYIVKSGFSKVVIGSSGGIDSAVVAALAAQAIGAKNVHCIMMPSKYSSEGSVLDAQQLHTNLGCYEYKMAIDPDQFNATFTEGFTNLSVNKERFKNFDPEAEFATHHPSADENLQARMRALNIMYFSNAFGALALTTGNKTELATGYFTLYGDSCGGYAPIKDLYKMEVYALAKWMNKKFKTMIPENIINKAPSAELAPNQTDEASLLPYPILDTIVKAFIEDYVTTSDGFEAWCDKQRTMDAYVNKDTNCILTFAFIATEPMWFHAYNRIIKLINHNEFKRQQAAPGIKLSRVAFGTGRRVPLVK